MNSELYFSFGSNMDRGQMKLRSPSAEYVGIGYIPNHDLVFNRKGTHIQDIQDGVASVVPREGVNTYGVIWAISQTELKEMDRIEDPLAYERIQKAVINEDGKEILCNVYVAFGQDDVTPNQPYLERVIQAAEAAGLPESWIARIKQYRAKQ